jgi:hypothetical protein
MSDEVKSEVTEEVVAEVELSSDEAIIDRGEEVKAIDAIINPPAVEEKEETKEKETEKKAVEGKVEEDTEKKSDAGAKVEEKSDTTGKVAEELSKLNLPPRLLQAAKRNHLTDQDVLDLGDKAEKVLFRFAESSDRVSAELGELGRKLKEKAALTSPKQEVKSTTLKVEVKDDDLDEVKELKNVVNSLTTQISNLTKQVTTKNEESTSASEIERDKKIDAFFDSKAAEYVEFGNSKELSPVALAMRRNIWDSADNILIGAQVSGQKVSIEEALDAAMSLYENKNPQKKKVSREQVLKEVETREKNLIQRPTSKKNSTPAAKDTRGELIKAVTKVLSKGEGGW